MAGHRGVGADESTSPNHHRGAFDELDDLTKCKDDNKDSNSRVYFIFTGFDCLMIKHTGGKFHRKMSS